MDTLLSFFSAFHGAADTTTAIVIVAIFCLSVGYFLATKIANFSTKKALAHAESVILGRIDAHEEVDDKRFTHLDQGMGASIDNLHAKVADVTDRVGEVRESVARIEGALGIPKAKNYKAS